MQSKDNNSIDKTEASRFSDKVINGDRKTLAKTITQIENETPLGFAVLEEIYSQTGKAQLIGITGAPGTGKSTLVNQLTAYYRKPEDGKSKSVAIVAVDPTSPFSGGAILGDRVRMQSLSGDPGVFIRSMASRGSLGGIAATTSAVVLALDAAGYDRIIIETVGAGQAEVDIANLVHTTVVVESPGMGDEIQAIKAGILEIADIIVINKADKPGADITERALLSSLQVNLRNQIEPNQYHNINNRLKEAQSSSEYDDIWNPSVIKTVATTGEGIDTLIRIIEEHFIFLRNSSELRRKEKKRLTFEFDVLLRDKLLSNWQRNSNKDLYDEIFQKTLSREISPWSAVDQLVDGEQR
jgi:LAO/AO transport system kinase